MKSRASLTLMELLIMVLVFSLAAAGCLRCFVWAKLTSEETAAYDRAVILAQNTAEALKITGGDTGQAASLVEVPQGLILQIQPIHTTLPGLQEANITIENSSGEILFSLIAAWQEDFP